MDLIWRNVRLFLRNTIISYARYNGICLLHINTTLDDPDLWCTRNWTCWWWILGTNSLFDTRLRENPHGLPLPDPNLLRHRFYIHSWLFLGDGWADKREEKQKKEANHIYTCATLLIPTKFFSNLALGLRQSGGWWFWSPQGSCLT